MKSCLRRSQVASAIAYLHDRGIGHRAVTAANVLLMNRDTADPVAKLSNFSACSSRRHAMDARKDVAGLALS